jgi:cephalosporin hydroxylase
VVETGTGGGGRALFCASICELIGHGRVLSIGDDEVPTLAEHDRITYLRRDPNDHAAELEVRELLGDRPRALLILAAAGRDRQLEVFERYAPLVPVGSYVVLEDTIVNGHPVWPGFGPGPSEAARELLRAGEFEPDPELERYALTFNPGGFLRRVAFADQPAEAPR